MSKRDYVIQTIQGAIYVKNRLDHQEYPKGAVSMLSGHVIIPDEERSSDDILEDIEKNNLMKHPEIVDEVYKKWFSVLSKREKVIVKLRCRPMGWKRVSAMALKITYRCYSKKHLRRIFDEAIDKIGKVFLK